MTWKRVAGCKGRFGEIRAGNAAVGLKFKEGATIHKFAEQLDMNKRKLDLMVIGAQKSGTSSLLRYLGEHPALLAQHATEFPWFIENDKHQLDISSFMDRHFPPLPEGKPMGHVAKMSNMYLFPAALERLRATFPECHVVFVVRDPVPRAYSAYRMVCSNGRMEFDPTYLARLIKQGKPGVHAYDMYVGYGFYAEALSKVHSIFPKHQVHVFRFEDLKRDPQVLCHKLFESVGIAPYVLCDKEQVHNQTHSVRSKRAASVISWVREEGHPIKSLVRGLLPYPMYLRLGHRLEELNRSKMPYPPMDHETKRAWGRFYRQHDQKLAEMTGLDLSGWTSQNTEYL